MEIRELNTQLAKYINATNRQQHFLEWLTIQNVVPYALDDTKLEARCPLCNKAKLCVTSKPDKADTWFLNCLSGRCYGKRNSFNGLPFGLIESLYHELDAKHRWEIARQIMTNIISNWHEIDIHSDAIQTQVLYSPYREQHIVNIMKTAPLESMLVPTHVMRIFPERVSLFVKATGLEPKILKLPTAKEV